VNTPHILELCQSLIWTSLQVSVPLLGICFVVGLLVGFLQILTSQQDSSFSSLPKLVAAALATIFLLPWMMKVSSNYAIQILSNLSQYAR
jgi:flagellar biosynthesis protein FliQ